MDSNHVLLLPLQLPDFTPQQLPISLHHYQLYAVENWLLARAISPFLIVYTANPAHSIPLLPQSPNSEDVWHSTLATLTAHGARQKQTPHGTLIVTSLAHFRSDYTIVPIPDGAFHNVRDQLYANINLLRTASSRRTALTLEDPSDSTRHRFLDAYRLPDPPTDHVSKPFVAVVLELVKLIQAALALFGMYPTPNATSLPSNLLLDGLLCDNTLQGIRTWTSCIGGPCLGLEATERVVDPLFVSAILSLVLSVRNKLAYLAYPLPRDPFLYPYHFSNALSLFIQSTSPVVPQPPSHHRTFSSPYHAAVHTSTPIIPAAPPSTNILSASAAAAAAAPYSQPQPPVNPVLTRDLIESISNAYSAKLKTENRRVRRVIKNRLGANPSPIPAASPAGVDSDGTVDIGHESARETRKHTLSLSLSLSGGSEGPGAALDRDRSAHLDPVQGTSVGGAQGSAGGVTSIGPSPGQLLSGLGSSLASGFGLGSNNMCPGGPLADLTVPTLDLSSFTSLGSRTRNVKRRDKKSRKSRERYPEGTGGGDTADYLSAGGGGAIAGPSISSGYHQDKDKERDAIVGGTIEALWSGRITGLLRAREEAEACNASSSQPPSISAPPSLGWAPSPALGGSSSISVPGQRPHRRRLHRPSDSLSVLGDRDKWGRRTKDKDKDKEKEKSPTPAVGLGAPFSMKTRTKMGPPHPASDGDNDINDRASVLSGERERERRYDGRSTEEESDVFGSGRPVGSRSSGALVGHTGTSPTPSFGGMWGGRVRGKLGSWAGLTKKKNHGQGHGSSVDLGSNTPPPLPLSASSSTSKDNPQDQNQNQDGNRNPVQRSVSASAAGIGSTALPKLIITQNTGSAQGSVSSRPSVSRRSTMPASVSGPQSPTLPPMVFSVDGGDEEDDDDLLSSGQISPLSDYRPNPFNMLSSTSNINLNTVGPNGLNNNNSNSTFARTGISPEVYEKTLTRLLRHRSPGDRRVPQSARVASWADPLSASVRSDEEMDDESRVNDDDEFDRDEMLQQEDEEEEGEEELDEDVLSIASSSNLMYSNMKKGVRGPRRPRPRYPTSTSPYHTRSLSLSQAKESEAEETQSDVSRMGRRVGPKSTKGKGREKARFHSLLSVLDGEGVLFEEPMEESEFDEYDGYGYDEDGGEFSEDGAGRYERESGFRRRGGARFDPRRRRSFHDLKSFRDVEVLSAERMKIDVDLCGHILIMWRREEHLRNVITSVKLITQSLSKTNVALREHYETHLPALDEISRSTSVLSALDTERSRSLKILQSTNTLEYESAQFLVDELWQTASPSRRKVFALRDKVFNTNGGRRLPAGVHGAHGSFNRLQWTLDGKKRLVDYLGRTESEAEEEKRLEALSAGRRGHGHPGMFMDAHATLVDNDEEEGDQEEEIQKKEAEEEADANVGVVEHPAIKPVWLLRFFTSWGARWSAAAAATTPTPTATSAATSPPATGLQSPANEEEETSSENLPKAIPPVNQLTHRMATNKSS